MTITVKDKEIEIKFGMGFVRELDKKFDKRLEDVVMRALDFGASVELAVPMLIDGDAKILADFLYYGTNWMTSGRPTMKDIDKFIDEAEDIEAVFDEVIEELKNANACRRQAINGENNMKQGREETETLMEESA